MYQYKWLWLTIVAISFFANSHASVLNEGSSQVELKVVEITASNFDQEIIRSAQPVVLMIYGDWCCCCSRFKPIFQSIAQEYGDVRFAIINYDAQYDLVSLYQPAYVPTFVFIYRGFVINQTDDIESREDLEAHILTLTEQAH
ncbi:putative thioredoxin domain-containing protein [Candidatus Protochlamydia naegleriophila]|uniref:Putative thioredoxin domain-containing protein n=1 Tax=Candidatus Protochlamydia naegleriophila TaxID=389348 RepID=A0A0U5J9K7_9BACT|nr:thioredoxin family protein [Candidatus Protochlamydia naegleriophila]CUI16713.1 putative thioredoxin domain-containing protein [Candidatus Protochlamydia naegleriophila]